MRNLKRPLTTLKFRKQFLQAKKSGQQFVTKGFILQVKASQQNSQASLLSTPKVGFVVTRKLGNAVERNHIRRRLKAVANDAIAYHGKPNYWYVFIARSAIQNLSYDGLLQDLQWAMKRLDAWISEDRGQKTEDK